MSDHVKVRMADTYPYPVYNGKSGFSIRRREVKFCPMDIYEAGEFKGALELVEEKKEPEIKAEPEIIKNNEIKDEEPKPRRSRSNRKRQ